MAKTADKKKTEKALPKKATAKPAAAKVAQVSIEEVAEHVLKTLKSLNIEPQLQADIEWCLGSYRFDRNPIGLYEMAERAFSIFKVEQAKKTKGITTKLVGEVESVLKSR